jgi:hypothetical protein
MSSKRQCACRLLLLRILARCLKGTILRSLQRGTEDSSVLTKEVTSCVEAWLVHLTVVKAESIETKERL